VSHAITGVAYCSTAVVGSQVSGEAQHTQQWGLDTRCIDCPLRPSERSNDLLCTIQRGEMPCSVPPASTSLAAYSPVERSSLRSSTLKGTPLRGRLDERVLQPTATHRSIRSLIASQTSSTAALGQRCITSPCRALPTHLNLSVSTCAGVNSSFFDLLELLSLGSAVCPGCRPCILSASSMWSLAYSWDSGHIAIVRARLLVVGAGRRLVSASP
jgi:hypothetical protein